MLKKLFFKASFLSAIASGLNVLATIAIVRWYGAEAFTDFTVDLAVIGLFLLLLELVPSNYAVFKVQDDPDWLHSVSAVQSACVLVLIFLIYVLSKFGSVFNQYSPWMLVFVIASAGKRFLDIRLQSSGRLSEYLKNEVWTSIVKLPLIVGGVFTEIGSANALWAAISIGMVSAQVVWWLRNTDDLKYLTSLVAKDSWRRFASSKYDLHQYYLGAVLKRIKDNMVPILADVYFQSKSALAVFFLSYRGLVFVVGQIRIIEALINHRDTLAVAQTLSFLQKAKLAFVTQVVCILASTGLVYSSGITGQGVVVIFMLSAMTWPIVFYVFERAKAYSNYESSRINFAMAVNVLFLSSSIYAIKYFEWHSVALFISALIASEVSGLLSISFSRIRRRLP